MRSKTENRSKRRREQRGLLDAVLQTIGIEWDQRRLSGFIAYATKFCSSH